MWGSCVKHVGRWWPIGLLAGLWDSVIDLCFVVRYFVSILVLQSSWWGRESWLLCLSSWCLVVVVWLFLTMPRVCLLWYFLIITTYILWTGSTPLRGVCWGVWFGYWILVFATFYIRSKVADWKEVSYLNISARILPIRHCISLRDNEINTRKVYCTFVVGFTHSNSDIWKW